MRPSHGHVGDGLVDLEELQTPRGKLLAEERGNLERESTLRVVRGANQSLESLVAETAHRLVRESHRHHRTNQIRNVKLTEMLLHFLTAGKPERLRHIEAVVFSLETLVINPLLHHRFVTNDLHPRFEGLERHSWEALGVQTAKLILVIVVIRRTEDHAADTALGDESVGSLGRLHGDFFDLIERPEMMIENVFDDLCFTQPQRIV